MRHLDFYLPCWLLHIMLQCSEAGEKNKGFVFLSLWRLEGWFFRFDNANKILVIWCCKNTRSMPACYFSSNNLVTFHFQQDKQTYGNHLLWDVGKHWIRQLHHLYTSNICLLNKSLLPIIKTKKGKERGKREQNF